MDLKTFVAETLEQIVSGVRQAQSAEGGGAVNARATHAAVTGNLMGGGALGTFTRVDFDVAISAESAIGGKGGLRVFGVGSAEAGGDHKSGYANRVTFSVPVRLPEGDR